MTCVVFFFLVLTINRESSKKRKKYSFLNILPSFLPSFVGFLFVFFYPLLLVTCMSSLAVLAYTPTTYVKMSYAVPPSWKPDLYMEIVNPDDHQSVDVARKFLQDHPDYDINSRGNHGHTALHGALCVDDQGETLKILLAQPGMDVNRKTRNARTGLDEHSPVYLACLSTWVASNPVHWRILLEDERVDITAVDDFEGTTPLWGAASSNNLPAIKAMIAFRDNKDLNLKHIAKYGVGNFTPVEIAQVLRFDLVADLLTRFENDPIATRKEIRQELGLPPFSVAPLAITN